MSILRWIVTALIAGWCATASAQPESLDRYPSKPIKLVVPASPGGPSDVVARLFAERLSPALGQPVVVENRAGAAQTLGTATVAKADPDGYTLLFTTSTPIVTAPATLTNVPYDVTRDLVAVAQFGTTPLVLYGNANAGASSVKDMISLAKAKPGAITYGSYGTGSSAHLLVEYLSRQVNIELIHVPYRGVAPQVQDLVAGQIAFAVADIGIPAPFVKAGKLRALAVTGTHRASALPDVPTFGEQGIVGMEPFSPWWGLFAPIGVPRGIVQRLSVETVKIAKSADFGERLAGIGGTPTGIPFPEANELMLKDLARWREIVAQMPGVRLE